MTISSRVSDVRARRPQAKIGQPVEANYLNSLLTLINKNPQASQVSTVTVDTATNSHEYVITINGVDVSYTADGATSKIEIADGLAAAVNAEPLVRGQVSAVSDGVSVVTLTGLYPGVEFTLAEDSAKLSIATTTAAAEADSVAFGRLVVSGDYQSDEANELGSLAKASALTAQVDTITVDYAASETYTVVIEIAGERYLIGPILADTDDATTSALIHNAINAMMPANTVISTNPSATSVVLTAEVAGKAFKTTVGLETGTTARLSLAHTTATAATDINKVAKGISVYTTDEEVTEVEGTTVVYPANAGMMALRKGLIWVENSETIVRGDAVYVELGVTADNGKLFKASSATRVKVDGLTWERSARSSSGDDLAVVSVALG